MCTDIYTIVTGIYLEQFGTCYPNGSYFAIDNLNTMPLSCGTNRTLASGEVLLPNGSTCDNASRPIECTKKHEDDTNGFALMWTNNGSSCHSTSTGVRGYKCCLPYSCDNDSTDIIIANIYCK